MTVRVGLKKFKFNGHVSILINVTNPTEYVLLHANELLVTLVSAQTIKGSEYDLVLSECGPQLNKNLTPVVRLYARKKIDILFPFSDKTKQYSCFIFGNSNQTFNSQSPLLLSRLNEKT